VDLPEEPLWVIGDRTRFAQIVGNLLHNASKFTNEGGHVSVQLSRRPGERSAMLSIRDTGVGIEPELLPRVFEPFVQAEQNLARSRGGLGLGLALVKALVDLQEGQVSAASDGLGRGAEFTVRLPLVHAPAAQDRKQTDLPDKTHRSYRILIIEDNQVAAKNTQIFLAEDGHTVQTAYTGSSGIEAARRFQPEVVLCDIGLPGIDGYAVAQALRQEVGLKQVYLIAITGYGQDENLRRAVDAGFDAYLVKPVDFAALEEKLANLSLKNPIRALHGSSAS
jgi:CheY-like chemotaxis protein